ncbi:MAG: hypothetical protein J3K34DRAFT_386003 [Monoraphidium minutum]|nr:MAG: hypothetical protein J3K34DRAFT_386003 [Monoraphidium minutum]
MTRMAADVSSAHEALLREREALNNLQDQHEQLLRAQEVLAAELSMALGSYKPKATIDAGTPADKLLAMMTELLDGSLPNLQDILLIQSTILESRDIYQPFRLGKQLMESSALAGDVGLNLIHLLGDADSILRDRNAAAQGDGAGALSLQDLCARREHRGRASASASPSGSVSGDDAGGAAGGGADEFATLTGALAAIISAPTARAVGRPLGAGEYPDLASGGSVTRASALLHAAIRRKSAGPAGPAGPAGRRGSSLGLAPGASAGSELDASLQLQLQAAASAAGPPAAVLERVERLLAASGDWQFDAFALAEATQGHPLSTLAFYMFQREGLVSTFGISPVMLARFLRRMEEGYRTNPYHNATHAADVLQSLSTIIHRGGMATAYVDPLHMLACYTAAVLHDFEHGGLTNDFLVSSTDPLAITYNDKSPLENHHLAAAFKLLQQPDYNFTSVLTKAQADKFRKSVIELVLATDMKQHFSILSHFTTILLPLDENERLLSLQMALKCADLGHLTGSLAVHKQWVERLEQEFFLQGDVERANAMAISPLFDRNQMGITRSQVGFFDIVAIPLYSTLAKVFPGTKPLLVYLLRNYRYWVDAQQAAAAPGGGGASGGA